MDHQPLRGQRALVTGANSGIGAGIARALAAAGAAVAVNYVANDDAARAVVDDVRMQGVDGLAVRADVSKEAEVERMFDAVLGAWGALDIVVSNAGLQRDAALVEMTLDQWNTVIGVNLTGAFLCARAAARTMIRQGIRPGISRAAGKILFVSHSQASRRSAICRMTDLIAARTQMAMSLGFHIVFAVLGIAMPALIAAAEWRWLSKGDRNGLSLAKRWSKGTAILFAVGAVSGTVLSFELGLLWPRFMERAGPSIGPLFALEGFAFFTEAIFLGIYLYGWSRIPPPVHFLSGLIVVASGIASAISSSPRMRG